jgi:hypothetical protein
MFINNITNSFTLTNNCQKKIIIAVTFDIFIPVFVLPHILYPPNLLPQCPQILYFLSIIFSPPRIKISQHSFPTTYVTLITMLITSHSSPCLLCICAFVTLSFLIYYHIGLSPLSSFFYLFPSHYTPNTFHFIPPICLTPPLHLPHRHYLALS